MEINKYIGERIRNYRQSKNITQEELADFLNVSTQAVSRYELGDRKTDNDILFKLADYFNVSVNDFFPSLNFDNADRCELDADTVQIPVLGVIKAGIPIEAQQDIREYIEIPRSWTRGGKVFYGLFISGDSMFPKYETKDIVIFEKIEDYQLANGKDCAVMVNGDDATFKKVFLDNEGITLQPYNNMYPAMRFSKEQITNIPVKIIGIAREKRTRL